MSEQDTQGGDGEVGTCHVCGRIFPTQVELHEHLIKAHDEETLADPDRSLVDPELPRD